MCFSADPHQTGLRSRPSASTSPAPPDVTASTGLRQHAFGPHAHGLLRHLSSKTARREVLGYSRLALAPSAYDNAYLMPLISRRFFGRPFFLLIVNFILQYSIAYLLWRRTALTRRQFTEKLFGENDDDDHSAPCWYPDPIKKDQLMCTPDEVVYATSFSQLDLDLDGTWTFEEAARLDAEHVHRNERRVNMTQIYKNLIHQMKQHAGPRALGCDIGEEIEAFNQPTGFWKPAWIQNITSNGHVVVSYAKPATDASKAYLPQRFTRKLFNETIYTCSIPKCVDMDSGATDRGDTTCEDYNGYDACGLFDDSDFRAMDLCCTCGGGSRSPQLTGYDHLPVSLPLDEISNLQDFRLCMQRADHPAQQDECIINFTSLPQQVYETQIEPYMKYCLLPESDTCGNLHAENSLPQVSTNISATVPLFFKMAEIRMPSDLMPETICRKAVSLFCPKVLTLQSTLFQEERAEVCGKKSRRIRGDHVVVSYAASRVYQDELLGLTSPLFQVFLFLIVFLWGMASVAEFKNIFIWWNILLAQPLKDVTECLVEQWEADSDDCTLEVVGIPKKFRLLTMLLILFPRTVLQCCIFDIGIQYLLSVRNISDLILNSLALTFLVTIDEMLFVAFAGEQNAAWIQGTKPIRGRSFKCLDRLLAATYLPVGIMLFVPILSWLSYFLLLNVDTTVRLAHATYCLCDLRGQLCFTAGPLFG
ncbi:unnamed protein product [Durusdinium trenchii]|uniref:Uncharacterized protein n=1 Tax=Durusdinium trenchii TaxID=1381693 RepID=A0ABP0N8M5_9DINO